MPKIYYRSGIERGWNCYQGMLRYYLFIPTSDKIGYSLDLRKKISGVVPEYGPQAIPPSALPLPIHISIMFWVGCLVRLSHVLLVNPGCKRVQGYQNP